MKRRLKSVITLLLVAAMLLTTSYSYTSIVRADLEDGYDYDDDNNGDYYNEETEVEKPAEQTLAEEEHYQAEEVRIEVSQRIVSFGHVTKGDPNVPYQQITVTNVGNTSICLDYQTNDAEDIFDVVVPGILSLGPYQSTDIYVRMDSSKPAGYYTASIIVCPVGHIEATMNIGISAEIVAAEPRITHFSIAPANITLTAGSSYSFSVDVRGENGADTGVQWSVDGNTSSNTKVNENGQLVIGTDESSKSIAVRVKSKAYSQYNDYATVSIADSNYSVSTTPNPSNGGTTAGGCTVTGGKDVEVVAAPNNGFRFVNWSADGVVVSNSPKYIVKNVRKNYNLVAKFEPVNCYVKVNVNHSEGGTATGSTNVSYNGSITLTASPKSGYRFDGWYEGGKKISTESTIKFNNITSNREVTANFEQDTFTIRTQVTPEYSGSVSNDASYKKGSKAAISAKAYDGYEFEYWTVNNNIVSKDAYYTINNVDRDCIYVAHFKKKNAVTYPIVSSTNDNNGAIAPLGTIAVADGTDYTYFFAAKEGYTIGAVYVDGVNKGAVTSYTFKNVKGPHTIAASFVKIPTQKVTTTPKVVTSNKDTAKTETAKTETAKTETAKTDSTKTDADKKDESTVYDIIPEHSDVVEGEINTDEEYRPNDIENEDINNFLDYTEYTGILQKMNLSPESVREIIKSGKDMELLDLACQEQYLAVSIHNEYADAVHETENTGFMNVASVPNMGDVISALMTEDEKLEVLSGGNMQFNFNLVANNHLQSDDDKLMVNRALKDNVEIGNFFEIIFTKTVPGTTENITQLPVPLHVEINIPENLKAEGRVFYVMRSHKLPDGSLELSYLQNESNDSSTISFTTDRFSDYAIVYSGGKSQGFSQMTVVKIVAVAFVVAIIATIVLLIILTSVVHKKRRHRRKKA